MASTLRWGILGTGNIARQFTRGQSPGSRNVLSAVGSRGIHSAEQFAAAHGLPRAHGSYEALVADPGVDAVYLSLPNSMHHEWTIRSLRAGKHVLCEKPIAANAAEAEEMFDVAEREGRVLVEAFMYRSHPLTRAVRDVVQSGQIGELKLIRTSFCFRTTKIAGNIRFDASLAGGALMDVGCYCLNFARLFAGAEPTTVHGVGRLHESGVDALASGVLQFPAGVAATFTCGMTVQADNTASLCGSEGYVEIPVPWKPPRENAVYHVVRSTPPLMDGPAKVPAVPPRQTHHVTAPGELYALETEDFAAAVLDGRPPALDRRDSVGNMRLLDELRRQVGVTV
jgi:predicted dehydrogenase